MSQLCIEHQHVAAAIQWAILCVCIECELTRVRHGLCLARASAIATCSVKYKPISNNTVMWPGQLASTQRVPFFVIAGKSPLRLSITVSYATCIIYEHHDTNLTLAKLPKFAKQSGGAAAVCYVGPKALAELTRCTCGVVTCCSTTLASRCSSGKCGSCLLMTARMLAEVLVAAKDLAV